MYHMVTWFPTGIRTIRIIFSCLLISLVCQATVSAIEITVSGDINDWAFTPQKDNSQLSAISLSGSCIDKCHIYVYDNLDDFKPQDTAGHMAEYNTTSLSYVAGGVFLNTEMVVTGHDWSETVTGYKVNLDSTHRLIEDITSAGPFGPISIWVNQTVLYTDPSLKNDHRYHAVITIEGQEYA